MKVEVISVGTRLLMGDVLDTNTAYVTRCLREVAAQLTCKATVGEDLAILADAYQVGLRRADVVLSMGGFGENHQGIAQQAAARVMQQVTTKAAPGVAQAVLLGTADDAHGFLLEGERGTLICLPGYRRDMAYLMETEVLPYLRKRFVEAQKVGWLLLRTVGVMESSLKQQLNDLKLESHQRITFDSFAGQSNIRLWVNASKQEVLDRELEQMKQRVMARLGDHVFGVDDDRLEDVVLEQLEQNGRSLTIAECYTDQALVKLLAHSPIFERRVMKLRATDWRELNQILGLESLTPEQDLTRWCRLAAERLLVIKETDLGMLIYKNESQGGVQLIVTLASHLGVSVTQRSFGGHPENIDQWAGVLGLTHLRRWLLVHR